MNAEEDVSFRQEKILSHPQSWSSFLSSCASSCSSTNYGQRSFWAHEELVRAQDQQLIHGQEEEEQENDEELWFQIHCSSSFSFWILLSCPNFM